jgi:hypothetical protein
MAAKGTGFHYLTAIRIVFIVFLYRLWLTEAIPAFAVALFIMAYLVFALGSPYFNPHLKK